MFCSFLRYRSRSLFDFSAATAGELAQAEDHEFRRLDGRDPDLANDLAGLDQLRRIGLSVALDVERLGRRSPEQGPGSVDAGEEAAHIRRETAPQTFVVRFEHTP